MKLIAFLIVMTLASTASAFDVSSSHPAPGDMVTLTGTANPSQKVDFLTSFQMDLPVNSGTYEYVANGVDIPQKPNRLEVAATGVKDLNVGVKIGIWISKKFDANNGAASISHSDIPPGRYDLKVFGNALDGSSSVHLKVIAQTAVNADSAGKYNLAIDTSGIPTGAYTIQGAGETKTIQVGSGGTSSNFQNAGQSESGSTDETSASTGSFERQEPRTVAITSEVITWYAAHNGLDPKNQSQYSKAEKGLNNMISGGYWKIISQGEPLTEKAGDCQDQYCLVRGIGACTTCRQEEILLSSKANKPTAQKPAENASKVQNIITPQQQPAGQEKGFMGWLEDSLKGIFG